MKDINLIPREYILREKQRKLNFIFLTLGCSFFGLIALGIGLPYKIIENKTQELTILNQQLSDSKYKVISEVQEQLAKKNEELNSIQKLVREMEIDSIISRKTFDMLIGFLPPEMYIQKLHADNNEKTIKIEGTAGKSENVSEYTVELTNLPFVEHVDMKTSTEEVKANEENSFFENANHLKVVKYELTLRMKNGEGELKEHETQSE
ncbi:MAG: PilN domain-containing protein [Epulopiscium sp.]|nr:PilN domain-containing protein [Candidatus Epulonipiscium sp.]